MFLVNFKEENGLVTKIKTELVLKQENDLEFFEIDDSSNYHLSLSRTLYLKDHQKDLFKQKIIDALKKEKEKNLPMKLKCENVEIYLNDEKTRTFVAVAVENDERILKLIEIIDEILKDFGLPVYYQPAKLHFSLFWCKGNQKENFSLEFEDFDDEFEVEINEIFIKCGNKITKI